MHDLVFAQAARWWLSDESFEDKEGDEDFGAGGIDGYFAKEVTEAARILSRLAWSPWLARIDLRWRLRNSASVPRSAMHQRYDALSAMLSTHTASYPVRLESLSPRPNPTSLTRF